MKLITSLLLLCGSPLLLAEGPQEKLLFKADFEKNAFGRPTTLFEWLDFPLAEELGKNNGIVARELEQQPNKVLRLFAPPKGGMERNGDPSFSRAIEGLQQLDATTAIRLRFDYRNLGTAGTWSQVGLRSAQSRDQFVAVAFSGAVSDGSGGVAVRIPGQKPEFPATNGKKLQNLTIRQWYRFELLIQPGEGTVMLTASNLATGETLSTGPVAARNLGGAPLDEFFFGFPSSGRMLNYRFELDNLEVSSL